MPDPSPTSLVLCDENLPLLSIMRQFDFGQFVFLHQKPEGGRPAPVVVDPSGGRYQAFKDWLERTQKIEMQTPGRVPQTKVIGPRTDPLGGVSLQGLLDPRPTSPSAPIVMQVSA